MQELREPPTLEAADENATKEVSDPALRQAERKPGFQTVSLQEIERLYTPVIAASFGR